MLRVSLTVLACVLFFAGCTDTKEEFQGSPASEYAPSQAGKYFIYLLDSTVFVNLGTVEQVHKYQEKHVVDAVITDNLGRTSYRMFRYLRDSAGTQSWQPAGSFMITPTKEALEIIEDNRRMIRLAAPVIAGTSWKGARYLTYVIKGDSYDPYQPQYNFSIDDDMFEWNYKLESVGETVSFNGKTYNDVATVVGIDESTNVPITPNTAYASRLLSVDKFAKNIGLVYQDLILWEYQKRPDGTPYKTGFGVSRRLIEHN
jgi:hypothetical protein